MTTFKSNGTVSLDIRESLNDSLLFTIDGGRGNGYSASLDPADDAAIALAVMEAAQCDEEPSWDIESATYARQSAINWLMTARDRTAKEAEQAAEETELRGEAWNLYAAYCTIDENTNPCRWGRLMPSEQRRWLAVASIARTMNTEATK